MPLARYLLLGIALLAGSCARRPTAAPTAATTRPSAVATPAGPRLLFLGGRLTTVSGGPSRLEIAQLQVVPGELKQEPAGPSGPNVLRVSQLDAEGRLLSQQRLPHPLRPVVERVGDDLHTLGRIQAQPLTAEFFTRLTLQPTATLLRVEETLDQRPATLVELPLSTVKP